MEIEHLIRSTERAVGLKPSAMQGEARLRGLWRIIYSKTISPPWTCGSPCGAGVSSPFHIRRCAGLIQPARLARSRQGLWRLRIY